MYSVQLKTDIMMRKVEERNFYLFSPVTTYRKQGPPQFVPFGSSPALHCLAHPFLGRESRPKRMRDRFHLWDTQPWGMDRRICMQFSSMHPPRHTVDRSSQFMEHVGHTSRYLRDLHTLNSNQKTVTCRKLICIFRRYCLSQTNKTFLFFYNCSFLFFICSYSSKAPLKSLPILPFF